MSQKWKIGYFVHSTFHKSEHFQNFSKGVRFILAFAIFALHIRKLFFFFFFKLLFFQFIHEIILLMSLLHLLIIELLFSTLKVAYKSFSKSYWFGVWTPIELHGIWGIEQDFSFFCIGRMNDFLQLCGNSGIASQLWTLKFSGHKWIFHCNLNFVNQNSPEMNYWLQINFYEKKNFKFVFFFLKKFPRNSKKEFLVQSVFQQNLDIFSLFWQKLDLSRHFTGSKNTFFKALFGKNWMNSSFFFFLREISLWKKKWTKFFQEKFSTKKFLIHKKEIREFSLKIIFVSFHHAQNLKMGKCHTSFEK